MNTKSVPQKIAALISENFGRKVDLTEEDQMVIKNYNDSVALLQPDEKHLFFVNIKVQGEKCGFTNAGSQEYVLNTDKSNRYFVTVKTAWRCGVESGESYDTIIVEAGSKHALGCTDSGYVPVTYYTRTITGEVKITS